MAMSIVEPVTYLEEVIRTVSAIPYTLSGTPIMKNHLAFSEFFLGPLQFVCKALRKISSVWNPESAWKCACIIWHRLNNSLLTIMAKFSYIMLTTNKSHILTWEFLGNLGSGMTKTSPWAFCGPGRWLRWGAQCGSRGRSDSTSPGSTGAQT